MVLNHDGQKNTYEKRIAAVKVAFPVALPYPHVSVIHSALPLVFFFTYKRLSLSHKLLQVLGIVKRHFAVSLDRCNMQLCGTRLWRCCSSHRLVLFAG